MGNLPVALQLHSVRDAAEKDFFNTLGIVKEIGYDYVELTANFYGHTAGEIQEELKRLNLKAISAHIPIDLLIDDTCATIEKFINLGCEYIAVPWLDETRRPGAQAWATTVEAIKKIGKACSSVGVTLLYHNHDFEFVKISGEYALDLLYNNVSAQYLQAEIDTCWVKVAGVDPAAYLLRYVNRCPVVHLKDFVQDGGFDFRPIGYGIQDITAILEASLKARVKYIVVEQDSSTQCSTLEAAKLSRAYLKTLGY